MENLVQLCSHHHRLVHEGGFGVERDARGGLRFRRPSGEPFIGEATSTVAVGPPVEEQNARLGLRVDGDTCRPRSAGDRLDYDLAVVAMLN